MELKTREAGVRVMAGFGLVCFYTDDKVVDPRQSFIRASHAAGIDQISLVEHCSYYFSEWQKLQDDLERPFSFIIDPHEGLPHEHVRGPLTIEEAAEYYQPGGMLTTLAGYSRVGHRLFDDVIASIPENIRGSFVPGDAHVRLGWHDIYEAQYAETARLHATAFLSVSFSGSGYPERMDECRERIFALPVMQNFKRDLEAIIGPVKTLMISDI